MHDDKTTQQQKWRRKRQEEKNWTNDAKRDKKFDLIISKRSEYCIGLSLDE